MTPLGSSRMCATKKFILDWARGYAPGKWYITRQMVLAALDTYEIIESYPDDKYYPSYLVYAHYGQDVFPRLIRDDVPEITSGW